ncbi:MAG TPA: DUF6760 family protein [Acidimicrobiales bacterium]|jgi:hypothetical protein|nr:DUF6760 family protein [Acidimicrobiales bacterium]
MTYAASQLHEEIAYVAFHFHWSLNELLDLEHMRRRAFVHEIANLNNRLNQLAKGEDQ